MKNRIALCSVFLALSLFGCVACAKSTIVPQAKETAKETTPEDKLMNSEVMSEPRKENRIGGSMSPIEGEKLANETNVNIITKSDNIYTDAQKMETLTELTGEIDKLIESINNLEDAQDSELIFD